MTDIVEQLREAFQRKRYGAGGDYDPDFDLFDVAADELERLRAKIIAGGPDDDWDGAAGELRADNERLRAVLHVVEGVGAIARRALEPKP